MRITLAFLLTLAACKERPSAPVPMPSPAAPTAINAPGSQNLAPLAHLAPRLRDESARRPGARVTAEHVFASLTERGIQLESTKQVLAATAQASYCALGVTRETIAVAVCEYATTDAARAGKQLLDTRYAKLVPDAVRTLNGTTLITVANGNRHAAIRDRVLETFRSL
jgi:hypothetical protein